MGVRVNRGVAGGAARRMIRVRAPGGGRRLRNGVPCVGVGSGGGIGALVFGVLGAIDVRIGPGHLLRRCPVLEVLAVIDMGVAGVFVNLRGRRERAEPHQGSEERESPPHREKILRSRERASSPPISIPTTRPPAVIVGQEGVRCETPPSAGSRAPHTGSRFS